MVQEYPSLDLNHLRPAAQSLARLPDAERGARRSRSRAAGAPDPHPPTV